MMRVLVVDDEPLVREDILFLLREGGHAPEALQATDGEEALLLMSRHRVDAVLLDICMPGMDGLTLLKRIREARKDLPVVIISGWDDFEYARQAMRSGAMDYLLKPIDRQAFHEALRRVSDRAGRQDAAAAHAQREYGRIRAEQQVNQCLLGVPARAGAKGPAAVRALAAVLCYADTGRSLDEVLDTAASALTRRVEPLGAGCHVFPYYGASNELLIAVCGPSPDAHAALRQALAGVAEELSGAMAVCAATEAVQGAAGLQAAHLRLLDTLRQRFAGASGLMRPQPFPADAEDRRRALMRPLLSLQAQAANLDRGIARALLAGCFTPEFFSVTTAAQAQAAFTGLEGALLDACLPARESGRGSAADGSLQRFRTPEEAVEYLAEFLPLQRGGRQEDVAALMRDARAFVLDNFLHPLMLQALADRFHVNPNYLSCMYKEVHGVNFIDDLTGLRVRYAMRLLASGPIGISKVAELSGFSSQAYFQKVFKKHAGVTPNEYRLNILHRSSENR